MNRTAVLETASNLITGDRAESYGSYGDQMEGIALAFNGIYSTEGWNLEPKHVSMILMLLKLRRRVTSGDLDSSVDLCGYAALDAEYFTKPETKG